MFKSRNMKILLVITVVVILIALGFVRIWPKPIKAGMTKVNTWTKIELMLGWIYID